MVKDENLENDVSVQKGCLRFPDNFRFLSPSLQKLIASLDDTFKYMDSKGDFREKLAYPNENFNLIFSPTNKT